MSEKLLDPDALLAIEIRGNWGARMALTATNTTPLAELPPSAAGIVAALGPAEAHDGRKWHMCGAIGGLMRKVGFPRPKCEAVIREWLEPVCDRAQIEHALAHALGAWNKPAAEVSGEASLAELVGAEHAAIVRDAIVCARRPKRELAAPAEADPDRNAWHAPDEPGTDAPPLALDLTRQNTPRPTQLNVMRVLESVFGDRIRYEEFAGRVLVHGVDDSIGYFPDGEWSDAHTTALVVLCDSLRLNVSPGMCDRAVELHAREHSYNELTEFLAKCAAVWDGIARVDSWFVDYWSTEDSPAARTVARVFLLSLAARGLEPGCKVDTCPILRGAQGAKKSSGLAALAGAPWFADSPLPIGDKDAMQNIAGVWLWEFQEHAAVTSRERNAVKAFLSQRSDRFRASYGRHTHTVARTCTFVSSSNDDEILNDPTGARRFLVLDVGRVDVEGIARTREQVLGEAAARVLADERWWPEPEDDAVLNPGRESVREHDAWEDAIAQWLASPTAPDSFELRDVFLHAVPLETARIDQRAQKRAANALRVLGVRREHTMYGKRWLTPATPEPPLKFGPKK